MGFIIRGVASGIGLVSESVTHYKDKQKADKAVKENASSEECSRESPRQAPQYPTISQEEWVSSAAQAVVVKKEVDQRAFVGKRSGHGSQDRPPNRSSDSGGETSGSDEGVDGTEEAWDLDDAQAELESESHSSGDEEVKGKSVHKFLHKYPPPAPSGSAKPTPVNPLALPVILPQRRPRNRSRGFVRAYSPVLDNAGIDQDMWLDFLTTFDRSSMASPWINAINFANIGTFFMGIGPGLAVSVAISIAIEMAKEMHARTRTNTFLDRVNNEFFRPRGLYCLVMTWKPDSYWIREEVNLLSNISSAVNKDESVVLQKLQKFKSSSGQTYEFQLPGAAPLIYPLLDKLKDENSEEAARLRDKLLKSKKYLDNYWDKRAQAQYAGKNPDSVLATGPKQNFTSRYADPNHSASSGSLLALLTGGHLNPARSARMRKQAKREARRQKRDTMVADPFYLSPQTSHRSRSRSSRSPSASPGPSREASPIGMILKYTNPFAITQLLKKNVLYLMVVNMPSDEELAAATAQIKGVKTPSDENLAADMTGLKMGYENV